MTGYYQGSVNVGIPVPVPGINQFQVPHSALFGAAPAPNMSSHQCHQQPTMAFPTGRQPPMYASYQQKQSPLSSRGHPLNMDFVGFGSSASFASLSFGYCVCFLFWSATGWGGDDHLMAYQSLSRGPPRDRRSPLGSWLSTCIKYSTAGRSCSHQNLVPVGVPESLSNSLHISRTGWLLMNRMR